MTTYISNTKPSFKQILLNKLGLAALPIQVNCWFCNNDSYLLPGSKNTPDHWYCHLCENTNAIDSNGEILDPSIIETTRASHQRYSTPTVRTSAGTTNAKRTTNTRNSLCEPCQNQQAMIYHMLSHYIPDENDPNYQARCDSAEEYAKGLHRNYPICKGCQMKITAIVNEQYTHLKMRQVVVNQELSQTTSKETYWLVRPDTRTLWLKGITFCLVHAITIGFLWMAYWYYPYRLYSHLLQLDFLTWLEYDTWGRCLEHLLLEIMPALGQNTVNFIKTIPYCTLANEISACSWNVYDHLAVLVFINSMSFYIYDWHYILSKVLIQTHLNHWDLYKNLQHFLSLIRLVLTGVLLFVEDENDGRLFCMIMLILYVFIIVTSLWFLRSTNKSNFAYILEKNQTNLPEENLPEENLPEENLPEENLPEENLTKENLTKENLTKENLPKEDLPKEEEDERSSFDNLVYDINNISFHEE